MAVQLKSESRTCPSSPCEAGATLLGVIGPDGTVAYITPAATVSAQFVSDATALGNAEKRFRFAGACVEGKCAQWTGSRCSVIDRVAEETKNIERATSSLPACSIRTSCRWFAQNGAAACGVCPLVVTDGLSAST